MTDKYWDEITAELQGAVKTKGHPFRFFSLVTVGADNTPQVRTLVLRDVTPNLGLVFYTDARSQKIRQLQNEENVCLLFYNGSTMLQLKIHGTAEIMKDKKVLDTIWGSIPPQNQKDYTSTLPPGHPIETPDNIRYAQDQHYFCMVEVTPTTIEYLKLGVAHHTKALFVKKEKKWGGTFLIP